MRSYYNTNKLSDVDFLEAIGRARSQQEKILIYFKSLPGRRLAPHQVKAALFPEKTPITSVRRAITNLERDGLLIKTDRMIEGDFGAPVHTWASENKMAIWDEQQSKWEFKKIRVHNEECRKGIDIMQENEIRKFAVEYAKSFRGVFYKWGGDDPSGFDCSGFVIEVLKAVGCLKRIGDWTAAGLFELFEKIPENYIAPGDLVFWSNPAGKIIHVEMIIAGKLSIGASGGGSATITAVDAIRQNAYIKVRPIYSRPAIAGFANPYKPVYNI
jgi:hypothetical protein